MDDFVVEIEIIFIFITDAVAGDEIRKMILAQNASLSAFNQGVELTNEFVGGSVLFNALSLLCRKTVEHDFES